MQAILIGCFGMSGPKPYNQIGLYANGSQMDAGIRTPDVPKSACTEQNLPIASSAETFVIKKIQTLIGPLQILFYPIAMWFAFI